jgi:hypothetical protein
MEKNRKRLYEFGPFRLDASERLLLSAGEFDERDPRSTFDSIVREYKVNWLAWLENFADEEPGFAHLLPFSAVGNGDYYCFDYQRQKPSGERPVIIWTHETGECEDRALSFNEFLQKAEAGAYQWY